MERMLIALADMRENGEANMDAANKLIIGPTIMRERLAIETKLANAEKFDISQCTESTIVNHAASLKLLDGDGTSIGPLLLRTPAKPDCADEYEAHGYDCHGMGDCNVLQQTDKHRSSLWSHWTTVGPELFQVTVIGTDKKKFLIPCRDLTNETIESVSILHVGEKRLEFVYSGLSFLGSGLFYANHRRKFYPIVEGAVILYFSLDQTIPNSITFTKLGLGGMELLELVVNTWQRRLLE